VTGREVTAVLVFHPGGDGPFSERANAVTADATAAGCVGAGFRWSRDPSSAPLR
jgi:hypothetical protein